MENKYEENKLQLIPKSELYMQYMIELLNKLPRVEKFNIGNEYKKIMYEMQTNIYYLQKVGIKNWLPYLNRIDCELNIQRSLLRIMYKNRYIDCNKFNVSINYLAEIGKILGGLIKVYAKNNKKRI